jgi:hypothetical protein
MNRRSLSNVLSTFPFGPLLVPLLLISNSAAADLITIETKSFIAKVNINDPAQFDIENSCREKFNAFAVNCTLWGGENPSNGEQGTRDFRLWSQVNINTVCISNKVSSYAFSKVNASFGKEAFFQTSGDVVKPLSTNASPTNASSGADRIDFSYRVRGQPIAQVNSALALAKPRTCTFIWHEVSGALTCKDGVAKVTLKLRGSAFPSHRAWVNARLVDNLNQGPFKKLWECDPSDPTSVR